MMDYTKYSEISLIGRLAEKPEIFILSSGSVYVKAILAVDRTGKEEDQNKKYSGEFINLAVYFPKNMTDEDKMKLDHWERANRMDRVRVFGDMQEILNGNPRGASSRLLVYGTKWLTVYSKKPIQ